MALRPTGPRDPVVPGTRTGVARPGPAPAPVAPEPAEPRVAPKRGFRLRTAVTEAEIDAQIRRLMDLIANDNIDPNAPPGSYINFMI